MHVLKGTATASVSKIPSLFEMSLMFSYSFNRPVVSVSREGPCVVHSTRINSFLESIDPLPPAPCNLFTKETGSRVSHILDCVHCIPMVSVCSCSSWSPAVRLRAGQSSGCPESSGERFPPPGLCLPPEDLRCSPFSGRGPSRLFLVAEF